MARSWLGPRDWSPAPPTHPHPSDKQSQSQHTCHSRVSKSCQYVHMHMRYGHKYKCPIGIPLSLILSVKRVKNNFRIQPKNYDRRLPYSCHTLCLPSPRVRCLHVIDQFRSSIGIFCGLLLPDGSLRRLSGVKLSNNFRVNTVQELLGEDTKQRPSQVE